MKEISVTLCLRGETSRFLQWAQHFIRQVFFAGVAVGLFAGQDVPDGHQQFAGDGGNGFVFTAAFGELLEAFLPELRTAHRPPERRMALDSGFAFMLYSYWKPGARISG